MKPPLVVMLTVFLALVVDRALPQQANPPLTKDQVVDLVKFGMDGAELAKRIKERGIDFEPSDDYFEALRKAGAQEPVLQALREVKPKPLTREQVGKLVAGGVPSERAAALVKQHGIDFQADEQYFDTLRLAGADDTVIAALRKASKEARVRVDPKDGLKYVWIPPGTFIMGCSPGDNDCYNDEKPAHQVTITKGFWIGQTEVTVGAYKRFVQGRGRQMPDAPTFSSGWADENMPIVNVTWDDARDYCGWAGGRLPSEAEWEYAARGQTTDARYGNLDEVAWYGRNSSNQTHPVAQKRANGFGLFDVLGNVWEWVSDWYGENYYQNSPGQDPAGPVSGQLRVLRGGSRRDSTRALRVSFRNWGSPANRNDNNGFRCAWEAVSP
jgi:formylglycine-generating enzyme required for sulfatase activity